MSRIGKKPIPVPKGVKVDVQPGVVEVKGPKGKLQQALPPGIGFELEGDSSARETLRDGPAARQVPRPGAQPGGQRRRAA